jgi:hypothetical protein
LALARVLPELLGAEAPRSYLLLIQNQDELRPTGVELEVGFSAP